MSRNAVLHLAFVAAILTCFCQPGAAQTEFTAATEDVSSEIWDPIEPVNRGIFWFNDKLDVYVMEPVARGYDYVVPDPIKDCVGNFFNNLRYPSYLVSDLVQLKFTQAAEHTGRFLVNTVVGLGGIADVATGWGLEFNDEDFGTALAYQGVPPGPYIVIPFLGPSNLRDGFGRIVDSFLSPLYYAGSVGASEKEAWIIGVSTRALDLIDQRAGMFEAVKAAKDSSLDYYLFRQSAYYQYRRGLLEYGSASGQLEEEVDFSDAPVAEIEAPQGPTKK